MSDRSDRPLVGLVDLEQSHCVDCMRLADVPIPINRLRAIALAVYQHIPWFAGALLAACGISVGPQHLSLLEHGLLLWLVRAIVGTAFCIFFFQFVGRVAEHITPVFRNYSLCFSFDVNDQLHVHPAQYESLRDRFGRLSCEFRDRFGEQQGIIYRAKDVPVLEIQFRGLRARRVCLHNRYLLQTKWLVAVDAHWRLVLREADDYELRLPIFERDANGQPTNLSQQSIELALRLLAEESCTLRDFTEKGLSTWQEEHGQAVSTLQNTATAT